MPSCMFQFFPQTVVFFGGCGIFLLAFAEEFLVVHVGYVFEATSRSLQASSRVSAILTVNSSFDSLNMAFSRSM